MRQSVSKVAITSSQQQMYNEMIEAVVNSSAILKIRFLCHNLGSLLNLFYSKDLKKKYRGNLHNFALLRFIIFVK